MFNLFKFFKKQVKNDRRIALTTINPHVYVSTASYGNPAIYETMIFGGPRDEECHRNSSVEDAKECHKQIVHELNFSRYMNAVKVAGRLAIDEKDVACC